MSNWRRRDLAPRNKARNKRIEVFRPDRAVGCEGGVKRITRHIRNRLIDAPSHHDCDGVGVCGALRGWSLGRIVGMTTPASATLEPIRPSRYRVLSCRVLLRARLLCAWFVWCVWFGLARCHRRRWADCRMAHQYSARSGEPMWGVVMRRAFLLLWLIRAGVAQLVEQRFCKP